MKNLDPKIFNEFHRKYFRPLCVFALRILEDEHLANDVTTDALIKFLEEGNDINASDVRGRLFLFVKWGCGDVFRKRKSEKEKHQQWEKYQAAQAEAGDFGENMPLEDILLESELLGELLKEVENMAPKSLDALRGIYLEGRPAKELAKEFGIQPSTVYNNKAKGLELLRKLIELKRRNLPLLLIFWLLPDDLWKN